MKKSKSIKLEVTENFLSLKIILDDATILTSNEMCLKFIKNDILFKVYFEQWLGACIPKIELDTSWYNKRSIPKMEDTTSLVSLFKYYRKRKNNIKYNIKIEEKAKYLLDEIIPELRKWYNKYSDFNIHSVDTIMETRIIGNDTTLASISNIEASNGNVYIEEIRNYLYDASK